MPMAVFVFFKVFSPSPGKNTDRFLYKEHRCLPSGFVRQEKCGPLQNFLTDEMGAKGCTFPSYVYMFFASYRSSPAMYRTVRSGTPPSRASVPSPAAIFYCALISPPHHASLPWCASVNERVSGATHLSGAPSAPLWPRPSAL